MITSRLEEAEQFGILVKCQKTAGKYVIWEELSSPMMPRCDPMGCLSLMAF